MWKPICHWHTQKEKTPSRSGNLRKGVLFSAYGPSAIRQATCNSSSLLPPLAAVVAVAPSRGASGETVHFAGTAKASPTRGGGSASALTERLYKDGPALGSSLANLPHRANLPSGTSPRNATPPRRSNSPGAFCCMNRPENDMDLPWLNFTPFGAAAPRGFFSFSAPKYAESLR